MGGGGGAGWCFFDGINFHDPFMTSCHVPVPRPPLRPPCAGYWNDGRCRLPRPGTYISHNYISYFPNLKPVGNILQK